jgi:hypothetical protein
MIFVPYFYEQMRACVRASAVIFFVDTRMERVQGKDIITWMSLPMV